MNTRRPCELAALAFSRIFTSDFSPTVASPSVMNSTSGSVPGAGLARSASINASFRFVPPFDAIAMMYWRARSALPLSFTTGAGSKLAIESL